jgi:hypothetical protein
MKEIKTLQLEKYMIAYNKDTLQIGCRKHTIKEWKKFTKTDIEKMDSGAYEWWEKFKPIIMNIIEASPAE